jgi:hypothetical protein
VEDLAMADDAAMPTSEKAGEADPGPAPPGVSPVLFEEVELVPEDRAETLPRLRTAVPPPPRCATEPEPPLRWREVLAVVLLIGVCDATIYRGQGFAGYALLALVAPWLLLLGSPRPRPRAGFWIVAGMLLLLAARMVWLGSGLGVAAVFALLVASAMAIAGRYPYLLDVLVYAAQTSAAGYQGLAFYKRCEQQRGPVVPRSLWLKVALPLAALAVFGTLFVLANPDLVTSFVETWNRVFRWLWENLADYVPSWDEIVFWAAVAWVVIGLLRPVVRRSLLARFTKEGGPAPGESESSAEIPLYGALRNMLLAVIVLFGVYLVFEFRTLWFREFPKGFYYAGYAHEGAAWLTVALALATALLSMIFQGRVLRDPRVSRLRRLAWIWSAENLVLSAAVYNRLWIYIGFNGMTRMRTVAIFGMSAVMVGFLLVVWKIAYGRDFVWLLRRHLWTLAAAVYLFSLTPVDAMVHTYNVRRVLAGDLAPSVQISVHPISAEGVLVLHPLVRCDDEIIREGVCALLAERAEEAEANAERCERQGWTTYQVADRLLLEKLRAVREDWDVYADPAKRSPALARFHEYVYQWY